MSHRASELSEVENCLERQRGALRFPHALEARFQLLMRNYRATTSRPMTGRAIAAYNAFLIVDYVLLPRTFPLAAAIHVGVTLLILCFGLVTWNGPGMVVREVMAAATPLLMIAQVMFIYAINGNGEADQYQYLALITLLYMNVSQRPDFRFAAGASAMASAIYLGALLSSHSPPAVRVMGVAWLAGALFITLTANRRMERDARYTFLVGLRDRLRREKAEDAASRDPLTGLWNRRHLDERTEVLWREAEDENLPVSIVMIDVDHFKAFNDGYGHPAGDVCLKRVASAIVAELRAGADCAVRCGGEEFLLLLPGTGPHDAATSAERIRRAIEALGIPQQHRGRMAVVTASLGVASAMIGQRSAKALIAEADAALYSAKVAGRNRVWPEPAPAAPCEPQAPSAAPRARAASWPNRAQRS